MPRLVAFDVGIRCVPDWSTSGQIASHGLRVLSSLAGLCRFAAGCAESLPACGGSAGAQPSGQSHEWRSRFNGHVALMMNVCTLCRPPSPPSLPGATPERCAGTGYLPEVSHQWPASSRLRDGVDWPKHPGHAQWLDGSTGDW
jgi:hypothetical protein